MIKITAAIAALVMLCTAQAAAPDESRKAFDEARQAALPGPVDVPLAGQALLKLPAGHAFVPQPQAGRMLNAMATRGRTRACRG